MSGQGLFNLSYNFFGEMQMKSRDPTGHVTEKFIQRGGPSCKTECKVPFEFFFLNHGFYGCLKLRRTLIVVV